ncbi:MAG TPA: fatty acid--CoA ligase family protein [Acidimicrobiales bacterium]|nr:fatty acid--CoA ligase family protein [Acidimicrobiales bacterium]
MVADHRQQLSPDQLEAAVAGLAGGLRRGGVRRGDRIAWQLPNCVEALLLYRAAWRLGAIAAPVHHQFGESEVHRALVDVEPVMTFSRPGLPLMEGHATGTVPVGDESWDQLLGAPPVFVPACHPPDIAVALLTSGSTGSPKVVLHSHRGLATKALTMVGCHGLLPSDGVLMPAPMAHISGLLNGILVPSAASMRTVFMERWDPVEALELIGREHISFMIGPPTIFTALMSVDRFGEQAVSSLRLISSGATGVTPEFVERARAAFGAVVKRTYGCTEAPTLTTSGPEDGLTRARETDGRATGRDTKIRIVDPASGVLLPPGAQGEVQARGPELFVGYADAAQTAEAVVDGWFRTGDLGVIDDAGYLTIVGRTKELIIRGGENIAPAEIERVLEGHPLIRQAVAVGYPDERLGERVAVFVVGPPDFDLDACRAWMTDAGVARFKIPERVISVPELPVLSLGKPDRMGLKALLDA